ncbi:biopolymer transporter ExbD [Prosthecobacter sp.]|uniref:ExbD/TolR family protein n=1 Tax=Prosthecobacter sp. TaxID=1965333 RepID=UPI002ABB1EE1|nr:biopolymer transporter ExbD [Prosthecobacter sp.]MDZ4402311.1 biopolymer transporter ExbD [Prosthecobacter sp.]
MKRIIHSDTTTLGFQIAPMIDVVFVIMLFFMVVTGTVKVESALNTKLPSPGDTLVKLPVDEITIGILEDGTVTMNEEAFDSPRDKTLPALTQTLRRLAASSSQQQSVLVTIQAEEQTSYERVIDVLNSLHKAQIQNVTFTVGEQAL